MGTGGRGILWRRQKFSNKSKIYFHLSVCVWTTGLEGREGLEGLEGQRDWRDGGTEGPEGPEGQRDWRDRGTGGTGGTGGLEHGQGGTFNSGEHQMNNLREKLICFSLSVAEDEESTETFRNHQSTKELLNMLEMEAAVRQPESNTLDNIDEQNHNVN